MLHRTEMLLKSFCDKHHMNYDDYYQNDVFSFKINERYSAIIVSPSEDNFLAYLHVTTFEPDDIHLNTVLLALNMGFVENNMAVFCLEANSRSVLLAKTQSLDGYDVEALEMLLLALSEQAESFHVEYANIVENRVKTQAPRG